MPILSTFYGIIIQMYWCNHSPPHFHAVYAEDEVVIDIRTLVDWELCQLRQSPKKISPLL
ncbi:DUF4160 domain-containing protein [Nitrosospira sp. Nsp1]|uniref:DUF4160 domain-containing protein n=1 Tax=Nitrosospira sp. Nsp1 TaxID=136547 RepID=UPI00088B2349|nr:DUF4160 domain-containing protein [Nitrosospira sp. Nsp1]SCX47809.1 protein of unknown function [Nitrosospira sp. Nsp1]